MGLTFGIDNDASDRKNLLLQNLQIKEDKMDRRRMIGGLSALVASSTLGAGSAMTQDSTVHMWVGFPPGGQGDIVARLFAEHMRTELGRAVVVDNKPGAGGLTAATTFIRTAPKDGSVVMLHAGSTATTAPISRKVPPYNPAEDFSWIAQLTSAPFGIGVNPSLPVTDFKSLIEYVRARPGKLSYGHAGLGTTTHLATELLKDITGMDIVNVPYQGSAPAIVDTISGQVIFMLETFGTLMPYHRNGRLRVLAAFADKRTKLAPDIPTAREFGVDLESGTSNLLAAPIGTPPAVIDALSKAMSSVMAKPALQQRLEAQGIDPVLNSSPEHCKAFVTREVARLIPIVKKLGIAL